MRNEYCICKKYVSRLRAVSVPRITPHDIAMLAVGMWNGKLPCPTPSLASCPPPCLCHTSTQSWVLRGGAGIRQRTMRLERAELSAYRTHRPICRVHWQGLTHRACRLLRCASQLGLRCIASYARDVSYRKSDHITEASIRAASRRGDEASRQGRRREPLAIAKGAEVIVNRTGADALECGRLPFGVAILVH